MPNIVPRPFVHDEMNFQLTYEKKLEADEINAGFLELAYFGFCQMALERTQTAVRLVDENANMWNCTLQFVDRPYCLFKIGGGWDQMVKAQRIKVGARVIAGAPGVGVNETIYFLMLRH